MIKTFSSEQVHLNAFLANELTDFCINSSKKGMVKQINSNMVIKVQRNSTTEMYL